MHLDNETFRAVVTSTPLISIDLIIRNPDGNVLLGKRNNRPAKSNWFVPGGRIQKNERVDAAFRRLVKTELGIDLDISQSRYVGLYDHLYSDSIWGEDVSTHYVVNAFEVQLELDSALLPDTQHNAYAWFSVNELLHADDVHEHTKWYFIKGKEYS